MAKKKQLMALALSGLIGTVQAGEKEELLKLRNTTTNLIKQLVKQGVITDKAANEMIKQAEVEAGQQVAEAKASGAKEAVPADEVRVAYVPDFVKDEIRQQVRSELREEVVGDVMQKAKNEQWGMPNALPDWIKRFKLSGDIRLRSQHEYMADENIANSYIDWQAVNERGGLSAAGVDQFLNTTTDRQHFRERLRLGIDAIVTDGLKAGVRLATGNQRDPVSTNQSLGFTGQKYDFTVDRAYLQYDAFDDNKFKWLTLSGGRIKNPWYTGGGEFTGGSELVWDTDLSFEGFAGTVRHRLGGSDSLMANDDQTHSVFATAGAFPLQESALSSDKWLFGGQVGVDWGFVNQDNLKAALAYFDYVNVQAKQNTSVLGTCDLNSRGNTASRPEFMQGGNTLASICREGTGALASNPGMVGLASDYNIVNANISYEMAMFAPYRLRLSGDYAKNVGFNKAAVSRMLNGTVVEGKTNAWQFRADFGWPRAEVAGHWNVFAAYKYVERDAVLDAFTDSDLHLGGTNSKGWFIGGNYGLMKNVWLTGRWLSADIITGPPLGIDVLQIDVNTQF
ncbi:putative porin [Methylomonas sp. EFPC1]|uniref:putative porin n=1 Tax=Methylomonas sp. EFPC1 TaxID=2812647 RepID=UPI0019671ECB|nr:putative porin [Methylomonas sp. EFPC1]QSB02885.1 putative porin [Methylomonas sp. EFPC1]